MNLPALPDSELEALRRGDVCARTRLAEGIVGKVLTWCLHLGGPRLDAEDLAHDVLLLVFDRVGGLRDSRAFPKWLYTLTVHEVNRQRRRRWLTDLLPGLHLGEDVADERPARDETSARVRAAIDAMSPALREVLVLCDLDGNTDEEAGVLLGIPTGTVKSRLHRARRAFAAEARARDLAPDSAPTSLPERVS